jgi:hypothetical protein
MRGRCVFAVTGLTAKTFLADLVAGLRLEGFRERRLSKAPSRDNKRKGFYTLTKKGLDLMPLHGRLRSSG